MKISFGKKSRRVSTGQPTIRVTKNGKFALSTTAVEKIGIDISKHRVRVDYDRAYEWYIVVVDPGSSNYPDAINLCSPTRSQGLYFNLKAAADLFLEEMEQDNGITFSLATTPDESENLTEHRYAILTAGYIAELKEKNIRRVPNVRIPIAERMATTVQDEA
jgi:hypothetical protein